jgi:tetratricopeptide (TPR) repeat protein
LRSGVRTFLEVFPHTTLWMANESDVIFIGTLEPTEIDQGFLARLRSPEVAGDLARAGVNCPADLLAARIMDEDALRAYASGARLHTDDNMLLEFQAGRRVVQATQGVHIAKLLEHFRPTRFARLDEETNAQTAIQVDARRLTMRGTLERLGNRMDEALGYYDRAYAAAPGDPYVASTYSETYYQLGDALLAAGKYEEAIGVYEKAAGAPLTSDVWAAYDGLGMAYLALGRTASAREAFERAVQLNPCGSMSYLRLGDSYLALGDTAKAIPAYDRALVLGEWNLEAANNAAWLRAMRGQDLDRALEIARGLTRRDRDPNHLDTLGWVYYRRGDYGRAAEALERAIKIRPDLAESVYHLALVRKAQGDAAGAERLLRQVMEMDRGGQLGSQAESVLTR